MKCGLKATTLSLSLILIMTTAGCQDGSEPLPEVEVSIPESYEDDGKVWQKQASLMKSDNDCLSRFFTLHQGLVGSPEFEGPPTAFLSGKTDRRFYWLRPSSSGALWRCVEFRNRKFTVTDGAGNPFE